MRKHKLQVMRGVWIALQKDDKDREWELLDVTFFSKKTSKITVDVFYKQSYCPACKARRRTLYVRKTTRAGDRSSSIRAQVCLACCKTRKASRGN